jgi:hypothetical protein
MNKFLDALGQPKLNQKVINSVPRSTLIDLQINQWYWGSNRLSHKEKPRTQRIHCWIHQTFRKERTLILLKLFHEIQREGTLPNSFYEASISLVPKPDKDTIEKENCKPISLINLDAKFLNEILANQIQKHIKKTIHHDEVGFIPGMQGWFNIHEPIN